MDEIFQEMVKVVSEPKLIILISKLRKGSSMELDQLADWKNDSSDDVFSSKFDTSCVANPLNHTFINGKFSPLMKGSIKSPNKVVFRSLRSIWCLDLEESIS